MSDRTFEISVLPDDPFFTGTGAPDDEEVGLPYALDGRGFVVDLSDSLSWSHRYKHSSVQLLNTQQANSSGDNALVPPEVWRRSIESWHQGFEQKRYDRDTSQPARFLDSEGIDPWDSWNMSLLNETLLIHTLPPGRPLMTTVGQGVLFLAVGTQGYWFTSLETPPTSMTLPVSIVDCCSDGVALYTIDTAGAVLKYTAAGASTAFATVVTTDPNRPLLRYVSGFLIAAAGRKLWDISTGTPVAIYTHPLTTFWWRDACEGNGFVYLVGGIGDRWAVYKMPPKTDGSTFDPPTQAAPIPDGEIGYAVSSYLTYVLIGTGAGFRFGVAASDGNVTFGGVVTTDQPVRCFEGQDRFVWFGRSEVTGADRDAGLYRSDLSTFTTSLQPATAPDLTAATYQGVVSKVCTYVPAGNFAPIRVFTVDGVGMFAERTTKVASGWLDQGSIAFASSDDKMGLYAQVYHQPLVGRVALDIAYDGGAWFEIGSSIQAGATNMGHAKIAHAFVQAKLRYRLYRDPDNFIAGPTLTRVEMRALPVSTTASEWQLPILVAERIEYNGGLQDRNVQADLDLLRDLSRTKRPFTLREYDQRFEVHATDFLFIAERPTRDGRFPQGIFIINVREVG